MDGIMRGTMRGLVLGVLVLAAFVSGASVASAKDHKVSIQVDQNDPEVMNLVLNNATNVLEHYRAKGEDVQVEIVAYGPGLHMLRDDTSPVKDRSSSSRSAFHPASRSLPATTPSRGWRSARATPSPSSRRPRSSRPASCA